MTPSPHTVEHTEILFACLAPQHPTSLLAQSTQERIASTVELAELGLLPGRPRVTPIRTDNAPENLQIYASHLEHWMTEHYPDVARARDAANSAKSSKVSPHP